MTKITPIKLDDNTIIYMEVNEDVDVNLVNTEIIAEEEEEETLIHKGMSPMEIRQKMIQNFQIIQSTIHAYTVCSLKAFKQIPISNINKVILEFGIELGGEAGIPYITKGTAKSNMKITVECSFSENKIEII